MTPKQLQLQTLEAEISWIKDNSVIVECRIIEEYDVDSWSITVDRSWISDLYYRIKPTEEKKTTLDNVIKHIKNLDKLSDSDIHDRVVNVCVSPSEESSKCRGYVNDGFCIAKKCIYKADIVERIEFKK